MTYTENNDNDDANLHLSDLDLLTHALERYVSSGQPGTASLFVYSVGSQNKNKQHQFWAFMDELARRLGVRTDSYSLAHRGGNLNLAGLLLSDKKLAEEFDPLRLNRAEKSGTVIPVPVRKICAETAGRRCR